MNITVIDQGNCKKQLRLEFPPDEVLEKLERVAGELARTISVRGFRPGHVPKSVVKTRFKKELRNEVSSQLLPTALEEALNEKELRLVGKPEIDALSFGDDESLSVTFTIDVVPRFQLSDYKGLPLTRHVYRVSDKDVDDAIEKLRKEQAELVPVDRPAESGDNVLVDIKGNFVAAAPADADESGGSEKAASRESTEIKQQELSIVLGGEGVLEEFTKVFTGARAGETKDFSVTYKDDHPTARYAGKTANYVAEIVAVRVIELPELDDDFAQSINEDFKDVQSLRAYIREDLESHAKEKSDAELKEAAISRILERNKFEVPESLVETQAQTRVRQLARGLRERGVNVRDPKFNWEMFVQSQRPQAEEEVRSAFILSRIAESENLGATEQDVDDEIEDLAIASGKSVESVRANLTKQDALDSIKEQIERRKALDFVLASAEIEEEEAQPGGGGESSAKSGDPGTSVDPLTSE
ncbi:MAG TPA: trigger factor [Blastocatellia bacterium]